MNEYESLQRMYAELNDSSKWGNDFIKIADALTELEEIKRRADKVIFTYALDILDIERGLKHGDEKPINDFIEAINYILKGETK